MTIVLTLLTPNLITMKSFTNLLLFTLLLTLFNCSTENISMEEDFNTLDINASSRASVTDPCMTIDLIAGQNIVAGTVSVYMYKSDIMIKYETINDWKINATHLSIGNDGLHSFPTEESGDPKIGKFEFASSHTQTVAEYTHFIDKSNLSEKYYFAAQAVVVNSNGDEEVAWAKGNEFKGNNLAMYVTSKLSYCDINKEWQ